MTWNTIAAYFESYWCFCIMQIRKIISSWGVKLKSVKYSIKNISGNIEAVFFKCGTRNVNHKRDQMMLFMVMVINLYSVFSIGIFKCALQASDLWVRSDNIQPFKVGQRVLLGTVIITILSKLHLLNKSMYCCTAVVAYLQLGFSGLACWLTL